MRATSYRLLRPPLRKVLLSGTQGKYFSYSFCFFALKDAFNISLAVQNPNDSNCILVDKVVNPDGLKSHDRPRAQILKLRIVRVM